MTLPVEPPLEPMLSKAAADIPVGEGWLYEPKWDGFRGIVYRDGDRLDIMSRKGLDLARYFPELVEVLRDALPDRAVVDGEIILVLDWGLDFEALQQRIHPAASRVAKLAAEWPTRYVAFDLLALGDDDLRERPLEERQGLLRRALRAGPDCFMTPQTTDPAVAEHWFSEFEGAGLDGVIAKRVQQPYRPGERVMVKIKHQRTVDCVVGGYRVHKDGEGVGSLLLGLYDPEGTLHFVGHTSAFSAKQRRELRETLVPLQGDGGFGEGRTPGGPSRWSGGKDMSWVALRPELVCEVAFEHMQGPPPHVGAGLPRFRHAARILRWRTDKDPRQCTFDQLEPPQRFDFADVLRAADA